MITAEMVFMLQMLLTNRYNDFISFSSYHIFRSCYGKLKTISSDVVTNSVAVCIFFFFFSIHTELLDESNLYVSKVKLIMAMCYYFSQHKWCCYCDRLIQ